MRVRSFWSAAIVVLLIALVAGVAAYNVATHHSLGSAFVAAQPLQAAGFDDDYGYHHHHHGVGFGIFPGFFSLLFLFFIFRGLFWGGWYRRRRYWRDRYYDDRYYGDGYDRDRFDEWHRRAHDRMREDPPHQGGTQA